MIYEHCKRPILPRKRFVFRVAFHFTLAIGAAIIALSIGILGYHFLAHLHWIDSFLNASMILGGMGPVTELKDPGAKLFAGFYALFSGVVFIAVAGVVIAPFAHRLLHHFHLESGGEGEEV